MFGFNEAIISLMTNIRNWNMENTSVVYPIYPRTGDKSDGNFNPASNVTLAKNVYQWDTVNIPAGVVVTAKAPGLLLLANSVSITGLLTASGLGAAGGTTMISTSSPYIAESGASGCGIVGGGGGGGVTNVGSATCGNGGRGRTTGGRGKITQDPQFPATSGGNDVDAFFSLPGILGFPVGGGGGAGFTGIPPSIVYPGGNGGGYLIIVCRTFVLNSGGAVRAEGLNGAGAAGAGGGGGGGGGVVVIDALTIANNGTISVAGGAGGPGNYETAGNGGTGCKLIVQRGLR